MRHHEIHTFIIAKCILVCWTVLLGEWGREKGRQGERLTHDWFPKME